MIYFTSDLHFFHKSAIDFCGRPFEDVEDMNKSLIDNWNKVIKNGDHVYILGDFSFGKWDKTQKILGKLNGMKYLIYGNHDKQMRTHRFEKYFQWRGDLKEIKYKEYRFVLCHFAMLTWHKQHRGAIQLYGHSHGNLTEPDGLQMDVGVDCNNYEPISIEYVIERMNKKLIKITDRPLIN